MTTPLWEYPISALADMLMWLLGDAALVTTAHCLVGACTLAHDEASFSNVPVAYGVPDRPLYSPDSEPSPSLGTRHCRGVKAAPFSVLKKHEKKGKSQ